MSGGRFNYMDSTLKGEIFGYFYDDKKKTPPVNAFEDWEISSLVWDVLTLIHDYDWYASGDTGEKDWIKAKTAFKKKWFGQTQKARVKEIVDIVLGDAMDEIYKTFGVKQEIKPGTRSNFERETEEET